VIYVVRQRGWFPLARVRGTVTRAGVIMQLLAGKREAQPIDEANPALCGKLSIDVHAFDFKVLGGLSLSR